MFDLTLCHTGFGENLRAACNYCKHNNEDKCCQTVNYCRHYLSVGAIIGIVMGCVGAVVMVIIFSVWLCCRKKQSPFHQFMTTAGSSTATTTTVSQLQQKPIPTTQIRESTSFCGVLHNQPSDKLEMTTQHSPTLLPIAATPFTITTSTTEVDNLNNEELFVVIHPYEPKMPDELGLDRGDIVCLALHFDDGWALGFNVTTGLKGAFPLVCISLAPEDSLDQLLRMEEISSPASLLSEDQDNLHSTMDKLREDAQKSLSLNSYRNSIHSTKNKNTNQLSINTDYHHSNNNTTLKRSTSNNKSTYDYIEADSPSSPTLHTPFFNENVHKAQLTLQQQQQQQQRQQQRQQHRQQHIESDRIPLP